MRITWVLRKVDCNTTPDVLGAMLGPSDLDDPRALTLQTGDVAALDGVPPAGMSPVGVCSTTRPGSSYSYGYGSGQYECVAAILETPGATPVLMVTPRQWDASASGDFISCCDSSNPNSRCSPKLDTRRNPGDEALSITNSGGTLRFDLTHGGPHEEGPVGDTPIQIAPIDPAAIAARPPVADGCRESRDKYHALVDTATGCTADADCQSLPALTLPGDALTCAVFVNRSVSASALQSVETQLYGMCQTTSGYCATPLPAICRAGRCAEQCAAELRNVGTARRTAARRGSAGRRRRRTSWHKMRGWLRCARPCSCAPFAPSAPRRPAARRAPRPPTRPRWRSPTAAPAPASTARGTSSSTPTTTAASTTAASRGRTATSTTRRPRDKSDLVEYDFARSPTLQVPGDWNTQRPELLYYEGTIWYERRFDARAARPGSRAVRAVRRGRAARDRLAQRPAPRRARGRLHAVRVRGDRARCARATTRIVVKVDNTRRADALPALNTDWWNYGGLTRGVRLVETPRVFVRDARVQLATATTPARARLRAARRRARRRQGHDRDPGGARRRTPSRPTRAGRAALRVPRDARALVARVAASSTTSSSAPATTACTIAIGFRTIATRGPDILLNGRPIFLRGISLHEEALGRGGRATSRADAEALLGLAKELGCNFVRLAHYPHGDEMTRAADRLGLLVWSEIPVYWTIAWSNPDTLADARGAARRRRSRATTTARR